MDRVEAIDVNDGKKYTLQVGDLVRHATDCRLLGLVVGEPKTVGGNCYAILWNVGGPVKECWSKMLHKIG